MATLHCTRDTPPESLISEIKPLNKFDEQQFSQFSSMLITYLCDPGKTSWLKEQLNEFSEQHGINISALRNICKSLLSVLKNCVRLNLESSLLNEDFISLGLDEAKSSHFSAQWKENQAAMVRGTLSRTLMVNQLVDMEWKFGVTAASSELTKVGSTFLQLKLVLNKEHSTENVYMELTLPQFYSFLHEMEEAKSSLEFFS